MDRRTFLSCATVSLSHSLVYAEYLDDRDVATCFKGMDGTFVLYDKKNSKRLVYNVGRSYERFSPCSTFKIPNSLIGLETGVIADENHVIPWNGARYRIDAWNRDHTLGTALRDSVVWYYQELARRVGMERMREWIDKLGYGNLDLSGGIDRFWLGSSLTISACEEVEFLKKLYYGELPVSTRSMDIVRRIMIQRDTFWDTPRDKEMNNAQKGDIILRGKTGSHASDGKWRLGWFAGWLERKGGPVFFAVNISADDGASGKEARDIAMNLMEATGCVTR